MSDIIGTTSGRSGVIGAGGRRDAAARDNGGDFLIYSDAADSPPGSRADHAALDQSTRTY